MRITELQLRDTIREEISKIKSPPLMSEGLHYHMKNSMSLTENIYRPGSKAFFSLFCEARKLWKVGEYTPINEIEIELLDSNIGEFDIYEGKVVPLDFPKLYRSTIDEAKYKGREVKLGASGAKRAGGRAYVYVRNDKGKVVKVSFGSSMGDAMGDSDIHRKRRKSFGDRHNCSDKNDRTKPGYWSCRATKLFGRNIAGWW